MAGLMILVSFLAAGAFAKRIVTKHEQLQEQAVASGPGILPGSVQPALPLRPAVMPRASVPVGMSTPLGGNPGKYPAELHTGWKGLDTSTNVWMSAAEDDQDDQDVALALEEVAAAEAEQSAAAAAAKQEKEEKEEKYKRNVRQAYASLSLDIPQILQFESRAVGSINPYWRKTLMNWDIYTDDLETDFTNPVVPASLGLFAFFVPSGATSIKGKVSHKVGLHGLREFIDKFVGKAVVTGQDWCMDKELDWCVLIGDDSGLDPELSTHEGEQVITSFWKTELTMKNNLQEHKNNVAVGASIVTLKAISKFHLNEEGKIYRHSIDQLDMKLNQESLKPEDAQLFTAKLADARLGK